jgi:hypothetical protein
MHVIDTLYPHRDEMGGHETDHIIMSVTADGSGVSTISEDWKAQSGSAADYWLPCMAHFGTVIMCVEVLESRVGKETAVRVSRSLSRWNDVKMRRETVQLIIQALIDSVPDLQKLALESE